MHQACFDTPFGPVLVCASPQGISGLYFVDQKDCPTVAGKPVPRPDSLQPSSGMAGNVALRGLRPVRRQPQAKRTPQARPQVDMVRMQHDNVPDAVLDLFTRAQQELAQYFTGTRKQFSFPLDLSGTPFQSKVWKALCDVPYGEVISYGQLALRAGLTPHHGRAVGAAVGRNPLTIVVPCHRIIGSNQTLTGYSGGLSRKVALLELEGFELN